MIVIFSTEEISFFLDSMNRAAQNSRVACGGS